MQGHIKIECPNVVNKEKGFNKKVRKAHIAWQDNDDSSSNSTSRDDDEANLCLMAKDVSDTSTVSFNSSENFENYSQLLHFFKE